MVNTVNELFKEVDEMMDICTKEMITSDMIEMMDEKTFSMMKSMFKLLDISKKLALKQATMMEEQNKKLDMLLKRNCKKN